jgi:hypothetical protein
MHRVHPLATASVAFFVALLSACGGGGPLENPTLPYEGTWRLVRVNGQALPARVDTVEVVSEDVRFLFTGSGFVRQVSRRYSSAAATTGSDGLCESWFGFQVAGAQISTLPAISQAPVGICPPQVVSRSYTLDGDTLRANGGTGFTLGAVPHAYVRVSLE